MKVHEYQAKEILARFGVPVPRSGAAATAEEAAEIFEKLGAGLCVVKAQVHAGGRGKGVIAFEDSEKEKIFKYVGKGEPCPGEVGHGRGIRLVRSADETIAAADDILGGDLITLQTGAEGKKVSRVLVEEGCEIEKELYLGMVLDRAQGKPVMMASRFGGMEIEKVAAEHPEAILKETIEPLLGMQAFQANNLAVKLGIPKGLLRKASALMLAVSKCFNATDASLVEINPLAITPDAVIALDAKMTFDDNALYRHADIAELRDESEEDPIEVRAKKYDLNYIHLDGNIGCMVNGAGLAMATMDIIKHYGGEPANFLDVGGTATADSVAGGFEIVTSDPNVEAILVNIFGGIMSCRVIAEGITEAMKRVEVKVPIVVRLEGNEVAQGKSLLDDCPHDIITATDMDDAAEKVVAAARGEIRRPE